MCFISVVIPVFNSVDTIGRAIASIRSSISYEVIIVIDDQRTRSDYLMPEMGKENIKIYKNSRNMGVTYSRNKGFFRSTGSLVVFLDADDEFIVPLQDIWSIMADIDASVFLFRCIDDQNLTIGSGASVEGLRVGTTDTLVEMNRKGERLLAIKKVGCSKPPFLGQTRGHELAGLIRFLGFRNKETVFYSNLCARRYFNKNTDSLSKKRFENRLPIGFGHYIVFRYLLKRHRLNSILWLLKSFYRRIRFIPKR